MPNPSERIEPLRADSLALADDLLTRAAEFDLAPAPPPLQEAARLLREGRYRVLVVGETRRGKSSFINALIGQPLLPVDVEVTTRQAFRIRPAEQPRYRLRLLDGSAQDIGPADLAHYGSQVVLDEADEEPRLDQVIDAIEIDIPVRFLPPGVELFDTPGLGALHAAHAQITHRFIPQADAVIYVLDSTQPLGQLDLDTLDVILQTTPQVFFIQTKIDAFRRDDWQAIQQRNEAILAERFGSRLSASPKVWGISSKNLLQAAVTGDEDYRLVSRQPALIEALERFLFRATGLPRNGALLALAHTYHREGRETLSARRSTLTQVTRDYQHQLASLGALARQWQAEWGEGSPQRQAMRADMMAYRALAVQEFQQVFDARGPIAQNLRARIQAAPTLEAVQSLGEQLGDEVAGLVNQHWTQTYRTTLEHFNRVVTPFLQAADALRQQGRQLVVYDILASDPFAQAQQDPGNDELLRVLSDLGRAATFTLGAWNDSSPSGGGSSLPVLGALLTATLFPALATVATLFGGAWLFIKALGNQEKARQQQLHQARNNLEQHLQQTLATLHHHYFRVDLQASRRSLVDTRLDALQHSLEGSLADCAASHARGLRDDVERLEAEAALDQAQRTRAADQLTRQIDDWTTLGQRLQSLGHQLTDLNRQLTDAPEA